LIGSEFHPRTVRAPADPSGEGCPEIVHQRPADHACAVEVALHRIRQGREIGLRDEPLIGPRPGILEVMFVLGAQTQRAAGGEPVQHRQQ